MCESNKIHAEAQREFDEICQKGNYSQIAMATVAWTTALSACHNGNLRGLRHGATFPNGRLYVAESKLGATTGAAVVAFYGNGHCQDVFSSDVTGSGWFHGSDPQYRAGGRLP